MIDSSPSVFDRYPLRFPYLIRCRIWLEGKGIKRAVWHHKHLVLAKVNLNLVTHIYKKHAIGVLADDLLRLQIFVSAQREPEADQSEVVPFVLTSSPCFVMAASALMPPLLPVDRNTECLLDNEPVMVMHMRAHRVELRPVSVGDNWCAVLELAALRHP